jgi:nicotinate-nucleotide adenylyltransferase
MNVKERIGLFGGSFDPIHNGHLILAECAVNFVGLERVYFIPTAVPPHKASGELAGFEMRKRMVELAIESNPRFELCLLESAEHPAYTYETIASFSEQGFGREQIHLIIGSDSLEDMSAWKNPERIFASATIVAMRRPGRENIPSLPDGTALVVLESCSNSISSSEIRSMVREGKSIRYIVPEAVERFIRDNKLYIGAT